MDSKAALKRSIETAVISAFVSIFPIAFVLALLWRFPVPFSGYENGVDGAVHSIGGVLFYGIIGGFIVLAALGYLGGFLASKIKAKKNSTSRTLSLVMGMMAALVCGITLSILDKIIGTW